MPGMVFRLEGRANHTTTKVVGWVTKSYGLNDENHITVGRMESKTMMTLQTSTRMPDYRITMTMEQKARCVWRTLESGIHEFTFMESSHAAVDTWIEYLVKISQDEQQNPVMPMFRCLLDTRFSGPQPMYYALKQEDAWRRQMLAYFPNMRFRTAHIYRGSAVYVSMTQSLSRLFAENNFEQAFFQDDLDGAVGWLLA
jgi:hypothetical protein